MFEVVPNEEDTDPASSKMRLCREYWSVDEEGRFTFTVDQLAEAYHTRGHLISRAVARDCHALWLGALCPACGKGAVVRNRTEYQTLKSQIGRFAHAYSVCSDCRRLEALAKEREQLERRTRRQQQVEDAYAVVDVPLKPDPADYSLAVAFTVAALLDDDESVLTSGVSEPLRERFERLSPTVEFDVDCVAAANDAGLIRIHPDSMPESLVWNEDDSLTSSYYPALVRFYLTGSGQLPQRVADYRVSFAKIRDRVNWPDRWVDEFPDFHMDLMAAECKSYLIYCLGARGISFNPGETTDLHVRRGLKHYTLGQMYYFIWRAAAHAVDAQARNNITKKHAANSAVSWLGGTIDRAYNQGWDVKSYGRESDRPWSALSRMLLLQALSLDDPMEFRLSGEATRRVGQRLNWNRIDAANFERLVYQIVAEAPNYSNVGWLMHTNAPDHGRDVSATRIHVDPLSGRRQERVAFQCKHYLSSSIKDRDVRDAITSIEFWRDPPFDVLVVVTSGKFTADAVAWTERHNAKGERPFVELWNDAQLETLLAERPHLIGAYELR